MMDAAEEGAISGTVTGNCLSVQPVQWQHDRYLRVVECLASAGAPAIAGRGSPLPIPRAPRLARLKGWRAALEDPPLAPAGYRPTTFLNYPDVDKVLPSYFPPADKRVWGHLELGTSCRWGGEGWMAQAPPDLILCLQLPQRRSRALARLGHCRWLWLAARRKRWHPERHASFPPAFRDAARTLLLAAHRGARRPVPPTGGTAAGLALLGRLPAELLHRIIERAAYPLSRWRPAMEGGRWLKAVQAFDPNAFQEEFEGDHLEFDSEFEGE